LIALTLAMPASRCWADEFAALVTLVMDGESMRVQYQRSGKLKQDMCRLMRYNAPHAKGPARAEGIRARQKLAHLISNKNVTIKTSARDSHQRLLCEVWLPDGRSVNDLMRDPHPSAQHHK